MVDRFLSATSAIVRVKSDANRIAHTVINQDFYCRAPAIAKHKSCAIGLAQASLDKQQRGDQCRSGNHMAQWRREFSSGVRDDRLAFQEAAAQCFNTWPIHRQVKLQPTAITALYHQPTFHAFIN